MALAVIGQAELVGHGQFFSNALLGKLLIVSTGLATTLPLLGFAGAARRIPLSQVGFLQYITPTMQFLIGVVLFHEPFSVSRLIGFSLVWFALALLALESLWERFRLSRSSIRTQDATSGR
jgi:chloramphenicol-sensitive protein RarD